MTDAPLIIGSRGRLGRALNHVIETEHGEDLAGSIFVTRDEIDITDYFRLCSEMERLEPTVVVNCAAYAFVDGCETNRELAGMVNSEGARNVARAAKAVGARMIQISTDLVFDGARRVPYKEDDEPNPLSHYASTKLAGERLVADEIEDLVILRSSWFFGPWPADRYPEFFLEGLQTGAIYQMVKDRLGSPTYLRDLARAIVALMGGSYRGILHFANSGQPTSRFEVLETLAARLGVSTRGLVPITDAEWTADLAVRPIFSALDTSRFTDVTGIKPRPWQDTLDEYTRERVG